MKIIISHDVDHLTSLEHAFDLYFPKLAVRSLLELMKGGIDPGGITKRAKKILSNRWNNIRELTDFELKYKVPSTFFFGMANNLGLAYTTESAKPWIKYVLDRGFDAGVHGIAYENYDEIVKEREKFMELSELKEFGIRIHYLKRNSDTLNLLERAGYSFDSTIYSDKGPKKIGRMWEFPLLLMDSYLYYKSRLHFRDLESIKTQTQAAIQQHSAMGRQYCCILLHDIYFCDGFEILKGWYIWLIQYLHSEGIELISYKLALQELEGKREGLDFRTPL